MSDAISPQQFHDADGLEDWRVLLRRAHSVFRTGSFAVGVALVDAIGRLADAANHHPDVDLRYSCVVVRLSSHDVGGLSERDVALARGISRAAAALGVTADPAATLELEIAVDAMSRPAVRAFWHAVLAYDEVPIPGVAESAEARELNDPLGHGPAFWFQQMDVPRTERNRIHVDVTVPHDVARARVDAALAAGGRLVSAEHAPAFWVLADAEGNEACVSTWQGREAPEPTT